MENDKEQPSGEITSSRKPFSHGGSKTSSKLSLLFRSQKKKMILYWKSDRVEAVRKQARRLTRHGVRFCKSQFADLRRAVFDLKNRIRRELEPEDIITDPTPKFGAPASALRDYTPSTSFSIRPAVFAETTAKLRRILVVGGMDFFGTALVRQFNRRGLRDIVIVDGLENERWRNLPPLRFDEFMSPEEFAGSRRANSGSPETFSHVFYLSGWDGEVSPLALPKSLLASIAESGRFISLSPACSLGPNPNRKDLMLGRLENLRPETRPGVLSGLFDRYAMAHLTAKNYLSLKHYRLFGPHERRDHSIYGLVKMLHQQITATGVASLPENLRPGSPEGDRRHDFFPVREAVQMAVFLAESEEATGMYELGSGTASTVSDLARAVFEALGRKPVIEWVQDPCAIPSPQPDKADLSRLREAGWSQAAPSLNESVRDYVVNYLEAGDSRDDQDAASEESLPAGKPVPSAVSAPTRIFPTRKKPFAVRTAV